MQLDIIAITPKYYGIYYNVSFTYLCLLFTIYHGMSLKYNHCILPNCTQKDLEMGITYLHFDRLQFSYNFWLLV